MTKQVALLLLILQSLFAQGQTTNNNIQSTLAISNAEKDSVITSIKKLVADNYVITDKVKLISDSLLTNNYLLIHSRIEFLEKLNSDLNRLTHDKHLFVQYNPGVSRDLAASVDIHSEQDKKEASENYGFGLPEILTGNTGYLKLDYFADTTNAKQVVKQSIAPLLDADEIIIDLRNNLGGSGSMVQLLAAYFLPDSISDLLYVSYSDGKNVKLKADTIDSSLKYLNNPVYLLTNKETFSAAEAFAFILQNRHRAILVGETTAGAGNIAGPYAINQHFTINIPIGIIIDPKTKTGWEQKGVVPENKVNGEFALGIALELIAISKY